jgi:hypothetical protein
MVGAGFGSAEDGGGSSSSVAAPISVIVTGTTFTTTMDLHLTDEQAELLLAALDRLIENDRYPLSPRVKALREIRALLMPYPARPLASPPPRTYEPPSRGRYKRRR